MVKSVAKLLSTCYFVRKNMIYKQKAEKVKKENVIDMAVTFTAMIRVFEKDSKASIVKLLKDSFARLSDVKTQADYDKIHSEFCQNFSKKIRTAEKKLKNGTIKISRPASFGHAAKVIDIAIKVYVHYSNLPNIDTSLSITPFLKGAIDTPILSYLKNKYAREDILATNIELIDRKQYEALQGLIDKDIKEQYCNSILPVEYDDILWTKLNR